MKMGAVGGEVGGDHEVELMLKGELVVANEDGWMLKASGMLGCFSGQE